MCLVLCILDGAVNIYLRSCIMKIFVTINKCFYRVHFCRFTYCAINCIALILGFVTLGLLHVTSRQHSILNTCIAELLPTSLRHCLITCIDLTIHSQILIVMNLSCCTQRLLLIVFLMWISLNLSWVSLRLQLLWWLSRISHVTV